MRGAFTGASGSRRKVRPGRQRHALSRRDRRHVARRAGQAAARSAGRRVRRVGGSKPRKVDVRVVAATNKELEAEIAAGRFPRGSLLPAQRRADLMSRRCASGARICRCSPALSAAFARERRRAPRSSTPEALEALAAFDWPGNVRELRNTIERLLILASGPRITAGRRRAAHRRARRRQPVDSAARRLPSSRSSSLPRNAHFSR